MKLDDRTLAAALLLRNAPELHPFIDWLKARREDARDRLEASHSSTDSGRSLELREILEFIESSSDRLEKRRTQQ